jgi:hypothetical protein
MPRTTVHADSDLSVGAALDVVMACTDVCIRARESRRGIP